MSSSYNTCKMFRIQEKFENQCVMGLWLRVIKGSSLEPEGTAPCVHQAVLIGSSWLGVRHYAKQSHSGEHLLVVKDVCNPEICL